ncbi:hypothetical protein B9Z55_028097 [Caenorhabditis nigoni]|uniref:Uncharacterized protein n=1 Tax=Caenorhabditis nigoni TaxID=1611254 RepID=A0A2G5SCP8_9PELO|nr:hypothetical protein B9Z55_028097 [Caenorhabditis nigoni]
MLIFAEILKKFCNCSTKDCNSNRNISTSYRICFLGYFHHFPERLNEREQVARDPEELLQMIEDLDYEITLGERPQTLRREEIRPASPPSGTQSGPVT